MCLAQMGARIQGNATRPGTLPLRTTLPQVAAYQFIVEGAYDADTTVFRQALSLTDLPETALEMR